MPERNSNITFGNYLKSKREEAGLDLESIFMETRISKKLLDSIENEDHAKLPEPVHVSPYELGICTNKPFNIDRFRKFRVVFVFDGFKQFLADSGFHKNRFQIQSGFFSFGF